MTPWFANKTDPATVKLLASNADKLITQKQILREVWAGQMGDASHALRVHVNHLRNKLDTSGIEIRNEPGIGYGWSSRSLATKKRRMKLVHAPLSQMSFVPTSPPEALVSRWERAMFSPPELASASLDR
ncbi:MAG: operon transcriptional regulatory protein kdpE [Verrucomicrobiaceae bacterium]|nr:operon transcriptional regulatory protein kdpE [Verrucomicrobiaceae bacterium]MDB6119727.1 operon transcriptional regulatory protein kdpE [Verrucomicrobiaceae bacterium]